MRGTPSKVVLLFFTVILASIHVDFVWAQTNDEINAGIRFSFSTPGARSLALGGAFIGLADDATAAFSNPAGLTILSKPEVSLEGRSWSFINTYADRGHAFGPANECGFPDCGVDVVDGIQEGESESDASGLSFLSFVYPRNNWAIAIFRHELANFESRVETQGVFNEVGDTPFRLLPIVGALDLEITDVGISGAYSLTKNFSLGLGLSHYDFRINSMTERADFRDNGTGAGGFYGLPDFSNIDNFQEQEGADSDVSMTAGFLWAVNEIFSVGGVYRQGPDLEFAARSTKNATAEVVEQQAGFNVPDVYGFGIALRPTERLTFTVDYNDVEYSSLTENPVNVFDGPDESTPADAAAAKLSVEDAGEFRVGMEYIFSGMKFPLAIRLGGWRDPDHRVSFEGQPETNASEIGTSIRFRPGEDETHYSFGFGLVFGEKFQLDAAADLSDALDTASFSGVFRF